VNQIAIRVLVWDELAAGHVMLPMGPREGFDFKTECPGHESEQPGVLGGGEADKHAATSPATGVALEL
jgi:hypothetical protein